MIPDMGKHIPAPTSPLHILRTYLDMNVIDFADQSGLSRQTIYVLERGAPTKPETWHKLRERWGDEIRECRLRPEHFLLGSTELDGLV